ncbi:15-cis-phytoene synthase [Phaeovulum vinaykumarii]|uniref:Phytoene synthase n=1 Tax=Phaeovulum vinaykumarii TaxID=407234 RepID=A0A1N7L417_9RHOB|nr:phytoene/squalene synthase family protein [Phaeovulum vinaykumarii]SIS68612.1 phytoene synthase [Phaeovulum vinaykumarii]SOB99967.1 phytoene synthase [Phaeovulum vinaykumarii]
MIAAADLEHCREAIRTGSLSFHAASRVLPDAVRDPALALYAFCRVADDAVDEGDDKTHEVLGLRDRLDRVYSGRPMDAPADRAFAAVVEEFDMPRELPEALLEGFAWDAMGRRYDTLSGVMDYSARVAAVIGAMMCVLMRVRDPDTLARACDMGLAMQLTNIARDVGEDARAGRLFLPLEWFDEAGLKVEDFMAKPGPDPRVLAMVARLLREADRLYTRAAAGVPRLPLICRPGMYAAGTIYRGIGLEIARLGHDSVSQRAHTGPWRKLWWLSTSVMRAGVSAITPQEATLFAAPEPEVAFLVEAAAHPRHDYSRSDALLAALAQLEAKDQRVRQQRRMRVRQA